MPSYNFNHFTGRLKESTQFQPLYPISAARLEHYEPPKMTYDTVKTKPVTTDANVNAFKPISEKTLKLMEFFQRDLEYPVYKMRGTPDKILFGITVGLTAVCTALSLSFLVRRAFPPTN